jgi:hypothetical protein
MKHLSLRLLRKMRIAQAARILSGVGLHSAKYRRCGFPDCTLST